MPDIEMRNPPQHQDTAEEFAHRPRNHGTTFPFSDLFTKIFNPLNDNKKKPSGPHAALSRKKTGPNHVATTPQEIRRAIIERFISRWRKEVGDDIYPAFRLIVPEKDRERAMYGLKEKTIGKLLVQLIKIDKNSEDGFNLLNWKLPGQGKFRGGSSMAGDFAGRCFDVLTKRAMRSAPGDLTIDEVNDLLDRLSIAQKEEQQMSIMQEFYQRMNAEEMMWLIRIILRQMKIGATEKTIFDIWHPDADTLYNISSSLKRVCWELSNPSLRLEGEQTDIKPMECFQPQLAQFQMHSFEKMTQRLQRDATDSDSEFWIEEKLDGERMQLHMINGRFRFWSRKAKDYTELYGSSFDDAESALTQHLRPAFDPAVRSIILDGEMITWDAQLDIIVPFGTLKTAALEQKKNPYANQRPLFRVFDILYLNDKALNQFTLRDRRHALERVVSDVHRRLEIHKYTSATTPEAIEPLLRRVVEEASEGLVVKNPRSMYRLNERNDDWIKVKPEYMTEFGESLDCVVIGGYYGSGHRGGNISSYLCGLRADENHLASQPPSQNRDDALTCYSFFKVGGGFTAADYQAMRHHTDGKWHDWDKVNPPSFIRLGGGERQFERPDVWIRPDESVVVEAKAASVGLTDQFACGLTLRFPRFKRLRTDKSWTDALSIQQFKDLRQHVDQERKDKQFTVDQSRKKARTAGSTKKQLVVAGAHDKAAFADTAAPDAALANLFRGLTFHIMTESLAPSPKHSKAYIEGFVKAHGAAFTQNRSAQDTICVADRNLTSVASLKKQADKTIVRSTWLFDCIAQAETDVALGREPLLLPWEARRHIFFARAEDETMVRSAADDFGDGYARDVADADELARLLGSMPDKFDDDDDDDESNAQDFLTELTERGHDLGESPGWIFSGCVVLFESENAAVEYAATLVAFAGGRLARALDDEAVSHIVVPSGVDRDRARLAEIRRIVADRTSKRMPKIVSIEWVQESWAAKTRVDEDRFVVT